MLPLCFTGGSRGRENGLSQVIAKGCNQSGGQIQTRAKCLQRGPDGLVALAPGRLCLQLERVTQDHCAGQSVREMPPEGESFLSLPSHPTPLPEMGSSSSTFTCKDGGESHPAPSLGVTFSTCRFPNRWLFMLWYCKLQGRWGERRQENVYVDPGSADCTLYSCAGRTLRNGWDKPCSRCGEMSWSTAGSDVLPCGLGRACICSDMVRMRENT